MPPLKARLGEKGEVTLPPRIREALGVRPGDYIAMTETADGVLISTEEALARRAREGEAALIALVREIGAQLETQGITEEEQLDDMIKEAKRQAFREAYPNIPL
jgi:AbrB family looped-hinge helix DNA binding protein